MSTVETAVDAVCVKPTTWMCPLPVDSFAYPVSPLETSAAPQPSHAHPSAVASVFNGAKRIPTTFVPGKLTLPAETAGQFESPAPRQL